MECESCGRYRPSSEIIPVRVRGRVLVMACARCRRLTSADRWVAERRNATAALAGAPAA